MEFAIALNASRAIFTAGVHGDNQVGSRRVLIDVVREGCTVLPGSAPQAGGRDV
jgi:hypothetical protein